MPKITYLASVSDGKISFPSGVLDNTMLSMEVNNTSTNDTIPTSKAVYDSMVKFTPKSITEQDGVVTIASDKYLILPQVNQISYSGNYLQQGWYYQHFDISGLGTNEEIIAGTKNTVIFWLSDSTEQIVEDIQNPTYIPGFNSGFQIGWWMSGVNDGRFPYNEMCHFEIIAIDANKITVKLYAKNTWNLWWVNGWLRNGKVDLTGKLSKDDYTVYCNGATATTSQEKLIQTQCGSITISNISLFVGGANFFGSNKNITCGNSNYTTIGNTLTVGNGLINSTYSGTVLGSYNEPNGGILQVGGGSGEDDRKTLFSVYSGGEGKIKLNALTEIYKDVNIKNSNNANTVTILAESGNIYVNSTLGANTLKDNDNDKVIVARKSDGGLYKSNVTTQELSNVAGTTSPIQTQINYLTTSTLELSNALITKQNGGQLYLNGGYATTNCKPTFGAAQSLMFTYEVSEAEIDSNYWAVIGNCFDQIVGQTGISFAKLSSSARVGFNWGGTSNTRTLKTVQIAQFADGKPHAWALVCGKNATNGFLKLYRDGVLIISETSLALFEDFTPQNGFYFGRAQLTASNVVPAKGRLSRIAFFNFDVSESNALYSLADYQTGKSIPPTLYNPQATQRAELALENYTIARNTTTRLIKDLSAGGYDATITGDLRGDMDRRVEVFVDEIKTQIAQSTTTE